MRKFIPQGIFLLLAAAMVLSASYALGAFGGDHVAIADNKEYANGGFAYSGELKNGRFNGYGRVSLHGGASYTGGFADGRFDGEGYFYHADDGGVTDDWLFTGLYADGLISRGTFYSAGNMAVTYEDGAAGHNFAGPAWRYAGGSNERGQNGTGTFNFADGSVYAGSFLHGLADGEGIYTDAMGRTVYAGYFRNGFFGGHGRYESPDGWSYEGYFADGLFDGEGMMTIGDETVKGVWEKGVQIIRHE